MDTPAWLPYVGVVTGTIGTITGTVGAILGYKGYRQSQKMKALDLRLELRKAEVDYRRSVEELPELLRQARQSRQAVLAGLGTLHTGAFKTWLGEWEKDNASAKAMGEALPRDPSDHQKLSPRDLESKLVAVHDQQGLVAALRDKYRDYLAWDDKQREEIRADKRSEVQAKLSRT